MRHLFRTLGFSLLELLLALILSSLIAIGLMKLFAVVTANHRAIQNVAMLQENGRFVAKTLAMALMHTGLQCEVFDYTNAPVEWRRQMVKHTGLLLVMGQQTVAYFVGDTRRKSVRGKKIYALYRKRLGGQREELVPYVQDLQLMAGEYRDQQFHWLTPTAVRHWSLIKLVWLKLSLTGMNAALVRTWNLQYACQ